MKKETDDYICTVCLKRHKDFFASTKCCLDEPPKMPKRKTIRDRKKRETGIIKTAILSCLYRLKAE